MFASTFATEGGMLTLRSLAIAMAGAGVLAGLSVTPAQACDNDRYPCPVVAQPQEAADAAARPQLRKKASRAARHDEKARAKAERQASQGSSQTNAAAPVAQEQAADSGSKKAGGVVPTLNDEVGRNESPVAAAAAAWLVLPDTAGAGAQGAAGEQNAAAERVAADEEATPTVPANGVKMVDPNEVNELDLAATPAAPAASSWLSYLLATLGAALAAASTVRFFFG
jgi:hypothetical protein